MMSRLCNSIFHWLPKPAIFACLSLCSANSACAQDTVTVTNLCNNAIGTFNQQFNTISSQSKGVIPENSGLIVHTIHGPGTGAAELHLQQLNALTVNADQTCGDFMNMTPPIFLPWCGSNKNPQTHQWDDSSSWTYIRHDTLIHGVKIQRPDEVVCDTVNNKRYGLIFSNAYMNENNNLGCMYPLDGDTGNRTHMGCGISQNPNINKTDAQGACAATEDFSQYDKDFNNLLTDNNGQYASYAGSLICSLSKHQFNLWVKARKKINLSYTKWPVNEFVLFNWDTYSTQMLASQQYLVGIYYLTGCSMAKDGNRQDAQAIADLYKKWSGVDIPVVNLSNSAMRAKSKTPFSCL